MRRWLRLILLTFSTAMVACRGGEQARPGGVVPASATAPPVARGLLLARTEGIALREMDSGSERVIKPGADAVYYTYPRWSPDGTSIAYVINTRPTGKGTENWGADVAVSARDGTDERVVFKHSEVGTSVAGLAWAADGRSLYLGLVGPEGTDPRTPNSQIKIDRLDLASGARTTIAPGAAYPAVSPDGARIIFLSFGADGLPGGLWVADADGGNRRPLLRAANPGDRFAGLRWPSFSPDGQRIAFGAVLAESANVPTPVCRSGRRWPWQPRVAEAHGPPIDIWVIPAAGGEPELLAPLGADDPFVAWSPDGTALAIIETCNLYLLPLDGSGPRKIGPGTPQAQLDWR